MAATLRRIAPYAILTLLCLPAIQPYLGGGFPRTNDAAAHFFRAFELDRLIRAGIFFPGWGPDFAHGYGYPTFNYFPYFSHYLIEAFHLAGLPLLWAMRAAFASSILVAGWATFALVSDLFDSELSGLVAALAYVYSPYLLYTAHVRGGLPELVALAWLPLLLLAVKRLGIGDWRFFPVVSLTVASMAFSHPGGLVQASPFVALWATISHQSSVISYRSSVITAPPIADYWSLITARQSFVPFLSVGLALLLGLLLPAFHWLPARAELGFVQFDKGFGSAGIAYYLNFFHFGELFALPRWPIDLDLLNPPLARPLPLIAFALAIVAVFRWRQYSPQRRIVVAFFGFALFSSMFLTLDFSKFIWDRIPLLQQTLWPWRYLASASLAAAVLSGALFSDRSSVNGQQSSVISYQSSVGSGSLLTGHWSLITVSLIFLTALPWLYPPREALPENPTLADLARVELPPILVGTTTTGEYTPQWVEAWPDTSAGREAQLAEHEPERIDPASLPPGATFVPTVRNPRHVAYLITLPSRATVVYRGFYFPGWIGSLDNQPLELRPTKPEGLISFDVPAGQHVVKLQFVDTPIRKTGKIISLCAALVSIVVVGVLILRLSRLPSPVFLFQRDASPGEQASPFPHRERVPGGLGLKATLLLTLGLLIVKAVLDTGLTPLVRHGLTNEPPERVSHPLNADFGGELTLLGYDLPQAAIGADETATLNLYWKADHALGVPYGMNVRLVDERGISWSLPDIERPRDFRFFPGTDNWPTDQYILDPYVLRPIYGTPPGEYAIEVVAYRQWDLKEIGRLEIGRLKIDAPETRVRTQTVQPVPVGSRLTILSHGFDRAAAAPGAPVWVTLTWRADASFSTDLRARLDLEDLIGLHEFTIAESYPTTRWQPGDVLTDQILIRLPASLEAGQYRWFLTVLDSAGTPSGARVLLRDDFSVNAPDRLFALPLIAHPLDATLGDSISLRGYNLSTEIPHPGEPFTVSLVWQAKSEMPASYNVFLHLTDAQGNIVAQSDGAPANWTRPTTSWLEGEVVVDDRTLTLPADALPGEYALWAGMVYPDTGERLRVPGTQDNRVPLGKIVVSP